MSPLNKRKRIAVIVVAVIVVLLVATATALAMWVSSVNERLRGDDAEKVSDVLVAREESEPFYMMLIGSDARADDSSMGARSDTNIVVRVDPENNQLTLVSIPRDTMIELDGYGTQKFNAAYAYEGAAGAIREASELLGVDISHYAEVNFEMLEGLVDAIGGVDVVVESTIDDSDAGDVVIEAGEQHLDGEAALVFARSRSYVDGDFTRTYNQRLLVAAIVEKVLSLSVTDLPGVVQSAAECVTTDLTITDIIALALEFKNADGDLTIYSAMVPSTTGTVGGISYVFTDEETLAEMMAVVDAGGDPSGFTASPTASITSGTSESEDATGAGEESEPDVNADEEAADPAVDADAPDDGSGAVDESGGVGGDASDGGAESPSEGSGATDGETDSSGEDAESPTEPEASAPDAGGSADGGQTGGSEGDGGVAGAEAESTGAT